MIPAASPPAGHDAPATGIPVGLSDVLGAQRSPEAPGWPERVETAYRRGRQRQQRLLALLQNLQPGGLRDAALLAAPTTFSIGLPLVDLAYLWAAARQAGDHLTGSLAASTFLGTGQDYDRARSSSRSLMKPMPIPWAMARRVVRTAGWTPWWRLPLTMVAPHAVAVAHNRLLQDTARRSGLRVGFVHGDRFYRKAIAAAPGRDDGADELTEQFLSALAPDPCEVGEVLTARWWDLARPQIADVVARATLDLAAFRRPRRLPRTIWTGGGTRWSIRALALETRRRGGRVVTFDHGHNRCIYNQVGERTALLDTYVSDELVVATEPLRQRLMAPDVAALQLPGSAVTYSAYGRADDLVRFTTATKPSTRIRRRVLYAPGIYRGFRTNMPTPLPDVVYFGWQRRIADSLSRMPVDVLCRPHPEGIMQGRRHPLNDYFTCSPVSFENLVTDVDVLFFDEPFSRIFCIALITDKPLIYIDFGVPCFREDVAGLIERRCRVLKAVYDDGNRPFVPAQDLEDALCASPEPPADAVEECRRLIVGAA